jgi:hypothetical protein
VAFVVLALVAAKASTMVVDPDLDSLMVLLMALVFPIA